MFRSIIDDQSVSMERPLHLTETVRETLPSRAIERNIRQDSPLRPEDGIYDRARFIFSRARRMSGSRSTSIL